MMEPTGGESIFNIHVQLYENPSGELAIRLEGEKIYRRIGADAEHTFVDDAKKILRDGELPEGWHEMEPRELAYRDDWNLVGSMGYLDGETDKPAIELEVRPEELGAAARKYLGDIFH
jgi:hypothetical protein